MVGRITDTLGAAILYFARLVLNGEMDSGEAVKCIKRAQRLAEIERYGVPLMSYQTNDLNVIARRLGLE